MLFFHNLQGKNISFFLEFWYFNLGKDTPPPPPPQKKKKKCPHFMSVRMCLNSKTICVWRLAVVATWVLVENPQGNYLGLSFIHGGIVL